MHAHVFFSDFVTSNRFWHVVKFLIDGGHCPGNTVNEYGETLLHHAAR